VFAIVEPKEQISSSFSIKANLNSYFDNSLKILDPTIPPPPTITS